MNNVLEVLYGGAAGGGKSEGLLQAVSQYVDQPNYAGLILRRTYTELEKSGGLLERSHDWFAGTDAHWNGSMRYWSFPSGARIEFGYLEKQRDHLKYRSAEYQCICFDELTTFPEHHYTYLFSRLRRLEGSGIPIRMRGATNPGGEGHEWVKKRFNLPAGNDLGPDRKFIYADLRDNPWLDQDEYEKTLAELNPVVRAQLLKGDWTALGLGGVFNPGDYRLVEWDEVPPPHHFQSQIRFWDMASSEPTEANPDPDWTAGVRIGMTNPSFGKTRDPQTGHPRPDWYVFHVDRFRLDPSQTNHRLRETAAQDGAGVIQYFEEEKGAAGRLLVGNYRDSVLSGYDVRGWPVTGKKQDRITMAAGMVGAGRVYFVKGGYRYLSDWIPPFTTELGMYHPDLKLHDDQADGLAGGIITSRMVARVSGQNSGRVRQY